MKELAKIFTRRYSAVSTKEENYEQDNNYHRRKSLRPSRTLSQGVNIVNSFFNTRKAGERTRVPKFPFLLMAGGLLSIVIAIVCRIFQPYELIFRWKLIFEDGGEIFSLWEKPPIDLYVKIYLFNITNAEAFLSGKEKMRVEEVGPYVYKELLQHDDVVFNDNGTISTIPRHPLLWQEHLSEGRREDDVVMMLNIALLSISQVAADRSLFFRLPVNMLIRQTKSQPIVRMTAKEFMFGFQTPLTTLGNTFLPDWISFDRVGLIDRMYDFSADFETFYDGSTDASISGLYDTYRGSQNLPQWNDEHCSNIQMASDGTKFKSFLEPNETVKFFRKSMCRPQRMVKVGEEMVISELTAYKYMFEENALDNGEIDKRNKCYCRKGYCQPRGLIDVTDCYYGFPISLSYPHFMDGDPKLVEDIQGLKPNKTSHESYFMVNPRSGLPITCSVKFQINMHLRDVRSMTNVERFSDTTFPMLWFEITMHELPEPLKNRFHLYLNILPYVDPILVWGGQIIGIICLLFAVTKAIMKLPQFSAVANKYENKQNKYTKSNIRCGGVYQPCEVKLVDVNEKTILKSDDDDNDDGNNDAMMCEIDLKDDKKYILEQEPAISDDESNNSDNSTIQYSLQYSSDDNKGNQEKILGKKKYYTDNRPKDRDINNENSWVMGEATTLIDDVGNDNFQSLSDE